jgi:integrase
VAQLVEPDRGRDPGMGTAVPHRAGLFKQHTMPCHHALSEALHAYIAAAGIGADKKAFLFRTSRGHGGTALADQPMTQVDAWRMVRKPALTAGIMAPIGNHSFRATGITAHTQRLPCSDP